MATLPGSANLVYGIDPVLVEAREIQLWYYGLLVVDLRVWR